ncbi:hypothetical protein FA95DRAFT_1451096, partial [Auriscalpium vulgare]
IFPYPNLTSWLFARHHWLRKEKKTIADRQELQNMLLRDDFHARALEGVDMEKLDAIMANGSGHMPWEVDRDGWVQSDIVIDIPSGVKSTQASRRAELAEQRRIARHELDDDPSPDHGVRGHPFAVSGFWHRSLCAEIKRTLSTDPAACNFVFEPHLLEYVEPGTDGPAHGVYGELYNSSAFVNEDLRLQNSPKEPDCDLPRAIAALMFWSDATHVSQFGQAKVWPAYMYFGNQSKYERARPTSNAAHHVAYFPLVHTLQDFVRAQTDGKAATAALLTHCRRELFQGGWMLMLDDEFLAAYRHGLVVDCVDGIRRRIYPRIFTYSADYPEKVLIAGIRDKGSCPCPRCLISFDDIPGLGTAADTALRKDSVRYDDGLRRDLVATARDLIYNDGYVVNSTRVDELLKSQSLVPTVNAFSSRLADMDFDIHKMLAVDLLHEFELGVWKAVFSHLIRMIEASNPGNIHELNRRFRAVSSFSGIRSFADNVSDMKKIAARDFEDILQCAIPCFEGLLPAPHDLSTSELLYTLASWHALAKMRMHTDPSLAILQDATSALGVRLRYFAYITCAAFETKETEREYAARVRAESQRAPSTIAGPSSLSAPPRPATNGRRPRTFNLRTIKTHFLGDYVPFIRYSGTSDGVTTQIGEHEHRRVKARYARTNFRDATAQIVNIDIREARFRVMGYELREHGVNVPGLRSRQEALDMRPQEHHQIALSQKDAIELREWRLQHPGDPALETFVRELRQHIQQRTRAQPDTGTDSEALAAQVVFQHERIYKHATARINYTSYDLQREQDVVHPSAGRCGVMVYAPDHINDAGRSVPWLYAWVLGIYHTEVYLPDSSVNTRRIEFLWVRWMENDPSWSHGTHTSRLERVQFVRQGGGTRAFGFVDPAHVVRGCHLIPAFHYGRTNVLLGSSVARDPAGDWRYFYVNRFVDRDTMVRNLGVGIGH